MSGKPNIFYHIQSSFSRGVMSSYNTNNNKDYQTQELYAKQSLSIGKNIVIEKEQGLHSYYSKLLHKRFSTKVLTVVESDYVRLVPYIKQITKEEQIGQVFALTTQNRTPVINFIGQNRSIVQTTHEAPYTINQLKELDYAYVKNKLFLAHEDINTQVYKYTQNNPSLSNFSFSSTISGSQLTKYDGVFRSLKGIEDEEKISATINPSNQNIQLSNNTNYAFKAGDVFRFIEKVDPAQILGYLDASRFDPIHMIIRIVSVTAGTNGTQATYEVINGSKNIAQILNKEVNITQLFLNYDNPFFDDKQKYPSSILLTNDQRLALLIDDEIHLSEQGNYFSFFFLAEDFVKATAPRGHRSFQPNEKNSGYKMMMINDHLITFNGNCINISQYKGAEFAEKTLKIKNNTNIKPVSFGEMVLFVDDTASTVRVMPFNAKDQNDIYNMFDYSDNIIGKAKIKQIAIEHSPMPKLYVLLDNGTMVINNLDFTAPKREGVVTFEHSGGTIEDIVSLDFNGGSILVMSVKKKTKDGRTFISIEEYVNKKTYFGTEDVLLDSMFEKTIDISQLTITNNKIAVSLLDTDLLDDKTVSVFIKQYNENTKNIQHIRLQGDQDNLFVIKNNGKIYINRSELDSFAGVITLYLGDIFETQVAQAIYNIYDSQNGSFDFSNNSYSILQTSLLKEESSNIYSKFLLYNPVAESETDAKGPDLIKVIFNHTMHVKANSVKAMPIIKNKDTYFYCINTLSSKIEISTEN